MTQIENVVIKMWFNWKTEKQEELQILIATNDIVSSENYTSTSSAFQFGLLNLLPLRKILGN